MSKQSWPQHLARYRNLGVIGVLIILTAVAFEGSADRHARQWCSDSLEDVLKTYAIARSLNAVISVAQGTELAIQPVGVGITISAGEVLDPLNDLIEQFSTLVLVAAAALGIQLLLTEAAATPWLTGMMIACAAACIIQLGLRRATLPHWLVQATIIVLLLRFAVPAVSGAGTAAHALFFAPTQATAVETLQETSRVMDMAKQQLPQPEDSLLDQLSDAGRSLDIGARLESLAARSEVAITEVVKLMAVFILHSILLPIFGLWLVTRTALHYMRRPPG